MTTVQELHKLSRSRKNLERVTAALEAAREQLEELTGQVEEAETAAEEYEGCLEDTDLSADDRQELWDGLTECLVSLDPVFTQPEG